MLSPLKQLVPELHPLAFTSVVPIKRFCGVGVLNHRPHTPNIFNIPCTWSRWVTFLEYFKCRYSVTGCGFDPPTFNIKVKPELPLDLKRCIYTQLQLWQYVMLICTSHRYNLVIHCYRHSNSYNKLSLFSLFLFLHH